MNVTKLVTYSLLGLLVLIVVCNCFTIIRPGQRGVLIQLGEVKDKIFDEGFHFKAPFVQKVQRMDVKVQKQEDEANAASKDLQDVSTTIALNYHIDPGYVNKLWQEVGKDYGLRIIDPAIQESVKAATAMYTAEELITKRPEVKEAMKKALTERLGIKFIIVDEVSIINFSFSNAFTIAIEAKVQAEQEALKAQNELEKVKFEAEQRVVQAKGEAEAIRIQAQALMANSALIDLEAVNKWNGVLPQYMLSGAVPFINLK